MDQLFSKRYCCVCQHLGLSANLISRQVNVKYVFVITFKLL